MFNIRIKNINFYFRSIVFCTLVMLSVCAHAFTTPNDIYRLAQEGNIKTLTKLKDTIDIIDKNDTTALCQAVYRHDYSAFHLLIMVGANTNQRCIQRLSREEMNSFNVGYKSWFYQVKTGFIKPNWVDKKDSSAWLSSFEGYAIELGVIGVAAGAIAISGGGGSSSHNETKKSSIDCNGHGTLNTDGSCQCNEGYEGDTCNLEKTCENKYVTSCGAGYRQDTSDFCKSGEITLYMCIPNDCSGYTLNSCPDNMQCTACQSGDKTTYKKSACKAGWSGSACTEPQQCSGDYRTTCNEGYHLDTSSSCQSGTQILYKCKANDCSAYSENCGEGFNQVNACLSGTKQYYSCVPKSCGDGYIPGSTCAMGYVQEGQLCHSGDTSYIKCVEAPCTGYTQSCTTGYHEKLGDTCQSGTKIFVKCEENDCSAYPLSSCNEMYMNCSSCMTPTGQKYQKMNCKEGYEGDDCTTPATCSGYNTSCGEGYQVVSGDTCKSGTTTLVKCSENACEGYTVGNCPTNAEGCQTCMRGTTTTYQFSQCKDGWEGETCSEEKSCSEYPLTSCPSNAECNDTCRSGNTDKLKITKCTKTNYVPSSDGKSCVIHCAANKYASGDTCLNCPTGATSPENSSSINNCVCGSGYKLEGNICKQVDFINLEQHPGSTKTAAQFSAESEFIKGNFLNQINAQFAYEHGYNGYITNTTQDGSVSLSDNKIKVGVMDNYLDVNNPDISDNLVTAEVNGVTKPVGMNVDYGPCRGDDRTNCYALLKNEEKTKKYGEDVYDIAFYRSPTNYELVFNENNDSDYSRTDYEATFRAAFSSYSSTYDWDSDTKYNVGTTSNSSFNSALNSSEQDHGTHVTGIVAALNNSSGIQGVVPNAEVLFIQAAGVVKGDYLQGKWFESAMQNYADAGIKVINMSFGDSKTSYSGLSSKNAYDVYPYYEVKGMEIAAQNDIVVVRSAGNDGNNKEAILDAAYPLTTTFNGSGAYNLKNLNISVASVDKNDKLASYSQICGSTKGFCLSAPGGDLDRGVALFQQSSDYTTKSNALTEQRKALTEYENAYYNAKTDEEKEKARQEYNAHVDEYNNAVNEFNDWKSASLKDVYKEWGIYSTVKTDYTHTKEADGAAYGYKQGTSMAAPVVTGSVALLMSAYPYLESQDIVEILFRSANKNLEGWGSSLYNEVNKITVTDSLGQWTDRFGNKYAISSIYGHGEVDLDAATKPLGDVKVPVKGTNSKQSIVDTKLAIPLVINTDISASVPKSVMGLDDYNRPFSQSISGLVYRAKHNTDNFKRDFKSFTQPKLISTAGVQDKLSFAFSSSQTEDDLLGLGSLDMMYQFNDSNKMKFSYRSDVLAEKSLSEKVIANPFMDMTDSYALGHEFKLNSKLDFGFSAITGKNGFYETDEDNDDEFKKSMQAFDMSVVYKPVSKVSLKAVGGILREKDAVLGINGSGLFEMENSATYYTGAILEYSPSIPFTLSAAYYYGQSKMPTTSGLVQFDDIISDSFAFEAKYQPDEKHVLGFQFLSPLRIKKGSAIFNLPVARDLYSDTIYYDKTKVSLKPSARELDFGMYYLSQSDELDWRTELMMRLHPDHMTGVKPDYRALLGLSYKY